MVFSFIVFVFYFQNMFKKNLRRAIMRYINLSNILALKLIAPKVDKRFPTYQTLVDAKVLLPKEVN